MPPRQRYFPTEQAAQIPWLINFKDKLLNHQVTLGYSAGDLTAPLADTERSTYLLSTVTTETKQFAQGMTLAIRQSLYATTGGAPIALPVFALPALPPPPAATAPGALRRLFAFIKALKTRPQYVVSIGEELGIIGEEEDEDPNAIPAVAGVSVRGGEVVLPFVKSGHMGVWIESKINADTDWTFLAIDTSSPYNDVRELRVPNTPETRYYRLCFWDGEPTRIWTPTYNVVFAG